jgi:Zn-finger nucleic acid-binding protein
MTCPVCTSVPLVLAERQGIEIDYCPQCRGVWLDRGELDKLIERTEVASRTTRLDNDRDDDHDERGLFSRMRGDAPGRPRRRESILSELFDFGG